MFAQTVSAAIKSWSFVDILIGIIVIAAAIAIVFIVLKKLEIEIPSWVIQIFWIVVLCFVAILAIRLIFSM